MGIYRTYFSKDNTLIQNKYINTGLNPVIELFYGTLEKSICRYVFDFEVTEIANRIADFRIPDNGTVRHTLKMTNTLLYDKHLMGAKGAQDFRQHASSFDLVLTKAPQFWDEGTGYDYEYNNTLIDINAKLFETASNWFQATNLNDWAEPGMYSGTTSAHYNEVARQHFDLGDEDLSIDVTDLVAGLITSGRTGFYGLGLAFDAELEALRTDKLNSVGFYGKDTNSFYEPYIETTWNDTILDDRKEFYYGKDNKLYLYTNIRKNPTNLDQLPASVVIRDYNGDIAQTITSGITHESKGVYSVQINLSGDAYDDMTLVNFTDTWTNIHIDGKHISDVTNEFTIKEDNYFNVGTEVYEPEDFGFSFSGLRREEQIQQGEVRKVIIGVRKMYEYDNVVIDGLYYRLYIRQGRNQIDVITSAPVHRAFNQNYFYLETGWLIEQNYVLELTLHTNGIVIKKDDIAFSVINNYSGLINFNI